MQYLFALVLLAVALGFLLTGVACYATGWWTADLSCLFVPTPIRVSLGTLGFTDGDGNRGMYTDKLLPACFPLLTNDGGNRNLRIIGICALVVVIVGALFALFAVLQALGGMFDQCHVHRHARKARHAAHAAGFFGLIGGILMLGWFVGVANSYPTNVHLEVDYAQVLVLVAAPLSWLGAYFIHLASHHGGWERLL